MTPKQPLDYPIDHDQLEELRSPEHYPEFIKHPDQKTKDDQLKDYVEVDLAS